MCKTLIFLNAAALVAADSDMNSKHGALLVNNGKVRATGCNEQRTRIGGKNYCSVHAEMACIHRDQQRHFGHRFEGGKRRKGVQNYVQ